MSNRFSFFYATVFPFKRAHRLSFENECLHVHYLFIISILTYITSHLSAYVYMSSHHIAFYWKQLLSLAHIKFEECITIIIIIIAVHWNKSQVINNKWNLLECWLHSLKFGFSHITWMMGSCVWMSVWVCEYSLFSISTFIMCHFWSRFSL